jgi:hypothetical protein
VSSLLAERLNRLTTTLREEAKAASVGACPLADSLAREPSD